MSFIRNCRSAAAFLIPSLLLAIMPKCPACLAAYVALVTGTSLSLSAASSIRMTFVILCVAILSVLSIKPICRFLRNRYLSVSLQK